MKLTLLAPALFTALGAAQPGEPWPGPWVIVNGTDIYDVSHPFRVPDKGPPIDIYRLPPIKHAFIQSPDEASCDITGRYSFWELTTGEELVVDPPEHFTEMECWSHEGDHE